MSPSALFVTTVPITLEAFLVPFAEHFRAQGWRVDALANGATANPRIADAFDTASTSPGAATRSPRATSSARPRAVREIVVGRRLRHRPRAHADRGVRDALRAAQAPARRQRPGRHLHRARLPLLRGRLARRQPRLLRAMERLAAPWTDYLVTINDEDFAAARALGGIDPERVRYIPGIGVDIDALRPRRRRLPSSSPRVRAAARHRQPDDVHAHDGRRVRRR